MPKTLRQAMLDRAGKCSEDSPLRIKGTDAIVYQLGGEDWILQVPVEDCPIIADMRRIYLDVTGEPDRVARDFIKNYARWKLGWPPSDELYELMTSGRRFTSDSPIVLDRFMKIYQEDGGAWKLRIMINPEAEQEFDVPTPVPRDVAEGVVHTFRSVMFGR